MNQPLISVIVPIYGIERYLGICIESIIKQTYKNLEIILVDDGSKDRCPEICDLYAKKDTRIKVIHKENGGLVSARKAGIRIASGNYATYVDGDDWIEPGYYDGGQIDCKHENYFDYLDEDVKKAQLERFNNFLNEMKTKYGLSKLSVSARFSNGETWYKVDENLKEDVDGPAKEFIEELKEFKQFQIDRIKEYNGYDYDDVDIDVGGQDYEDCVNELLDIAQFYDKEFDNLTHTIESKVQDCVEKKMSIFEIVDYLIKDCKREFNENLKEDVEKQYFLRVKGVPQQVNNVKSQLEKEGYEIDRSDVGILFAKVPSQEEGIKKAHELIKNYSSIVCAVSTFKFEGLEEGYDPLFDALKDSGKSPIFAFDDGTVYGVEYKDGKLYAGSISNAGMSHQYEIDYDDDLDVDVNLQNLYDKIIETEPELLGERLDTKVTESRHIYKDCDGDIQVYNDWGVEYKETYKNAVIVYDEDKDKYTIWSTQSNRPLSRIGRNNQYEPIYFNSIEEIKKYVDKDNTNESLDNNISYVIYKENGKYKGTPKSNYDAQVRDANMVQDFSKFDDANKIVDYLTKNTNYKDKNTYKVIDEELSEDNNSLARKMGAKFLPPKDYGVKKKRPRYVYEVYYYTEPNSQGDPVYRKFSSRKAQQEWYEKHKDDPDKFDMYAWDDAYIEESLKDDKNTNHKKTIKEGYYDYIDKDYSELLDSDVNVYDVKQFVLDESDGKYRTHYTDDYAIIVCANGKGCIVDYEAVGQDFDSVKSEIKLGIEENKDNEYTDEQGVVHQTLNMFATHLVKTTPEEIIEKAPKKTMKYREFFRKYKYNDRCASNFKSLAEYIAKNDDLSKYNDVLDDAEKNEGCHSKKKGKKLKEGYIGQTLNDFFYDCVEPENIEKVTLWGEDDVVFEGDYSDAIDEFGDNEFIEFDCGADKVVINVDTSEEYQVTDYYVDVEEFIEFFNGDEIEVYDLNSGETLFSGYKEDCPDDVLEKIFISFDAPNYISINIEENDSDDDFDESLKKSKLKESYAGEDVNYFISVKCYDDDNFTKNLGAFCVVDEDGRIVDELNDYDLKKLIKIVSDGGSQASHLKDYDWLEVSFAGDCDWDDAQPKILNALIKGKLKGTFKVDNTIKEDTVKQNGKWVNKGDTGKTHGTFKTKKEADAQRKAMFVNKKKNANWGK